MTTGTPGGSGSPADDWFPTEGEALLERVGVDVGDDLEFPERGRGELTESELTHPSDHHEVASVESSEKLRVRVLLESGRNVDVLLRRPNERHVRLHDRAAGP